MTLYTFFTAACHYCRCMLPRCLLGIPSLACTLWTPIDFSRLMRFRLIPEEIDGHRVKAGYLTKQHTRGLSPINNRQGQWLPSNQSHKEPGPDNTGSYGVIVERQCSLNFNFYESQVPAEYCGLGTCSYNSF